MKKLMIAALAVAMGGVVFADCAAVDCAYAYRLKLAGKTVKGKAIAAKSACEEGACFAKPASLRIAGYLYSIEGETEGEEGCATCACDDLSGATTEGFWDENKVAVELEPAIAVYDVLRNGGAYNKAQILITLGGLNLAGFGVFNPRTTMLKSASGFFAGTLDAPQCQGAWDTEACEYGDATVAQVFKPCDLGAGVEAESAIAYGRWTLTYKADKVAQLKAGAAPASVLLPAAFKAADGEAAAE